ncbi:hypothetical protein Y032_0154g2982 [Ancylostoma ceylanicum]|uniref:Uncharacterized protein n=1 Tax=Ancylostoma ceylanicum TaxID=53326 RepID=A0A016T095_9BILA|nr:hypothetical protein Y032_0154g2982 [Ancylostoma ceylanicum]
MFKEDESRGATLTPPTSIFIGQQKHYEPNLGLWNSRAAKWMLPTPPSFIIMEEEEEKFRGSKPSALERSINESRDK